MGIDFGVFEAKVWILGHNSHQVGNYVHYSWICYDDIVSNVFKERC